MPFIARLRKYAAKRITQRAARPAVIAIPVGNGIPSEMSCSVKKPGQLSCDWKAAHLLKAGAELLEAGTMSLLPQNRNSVLLKDGRQAGNGGPGVPMAAALGKRLN